MVDPLAEAMRPHGHFEVECQRCGWVHWERVGIPVPCSCTDPDRGRPRHVIRETDDQQWLGPACWSGWEPYIPHVKRCGRPASPGVAYCDACAKTRPPVMLALGRAAIALERAIQRVRDRAFLLRRDFVRWRKRHSA